MGRNFNRDKRQREEREKRKHEEKAKKKAERAAQALASEGAVPPEDPAPLTDPENIV